VTCKDWTREIVEGARSGTRAGEALTHHLAHCPHCSDRWEAELELSRGFRQATASLRDLRSGEGARRRVMTEFARQRHGIQVRRGLVWATAALTTLLVAAVWKQSRHAATSSGVTPVEIAQVFAEDLADSDFVPVPYAPPLAPGEYVEVVQAELTPAALARMGFAISTASTSELTTDLMVGEDGLPRAVRVPESVGIRY
jgi:hypothetical protein